VASSARFVEKFRRPAGHYKIGLPPIRWAAGAGQGGDHIGDLGDVSRSFDRDAVCWRDKPVIAEGPGAVRRILRLQRQSREGLDSPFLDGQGGPFSAKQHLAHWPRCWSRWPRAPGLRASEVLGTGPALDLRLVGRDDKKRSPLAVDGKIGGGGHLRQRGGGGRKKPAKHANRVGARRNAMCHSRQFSGK